MPRRARVYIPDQPYHIVQRGNNREACFIRPVDYQYYLDLWREVSVRYGTKVHAYCLMTNHIHFLATPDTEGAISNTMKVVGSRYAQHINRSYRRTGTLWEGRHKSSLIQAERYLLRCYRYIEMNPVRAGLVESPEEYKWSSYGVNGWGDTSWLTPHPGYLSLGALPQDRQAAYRALFSELNIDRDLQLFRKAAHYCQPVGDDRFYRQLEKKYGKLGQMKRGRPGKSKTQGID